MLVARSIQESHYYMELHPCDACGEDDFAWSRHLMREQAGRRYTVYEGECPSCGTFRQFEFLLDEHATGPSQIIDPGEFLALALRAATSIPDDPDDLPDEEPDDLADAADLADLAVATLDEVIAFIPPGADAVPADAFVSEVGRELSARDPELFRRDRLEWLRAEREQVAADYSAAVRASAR